jgi:WD40 repeat protein
LSPDKKQILASEFIGSVSLWDLTTGKMLKRLEGDDSFEGHGEAMVDAVAFHPSGRFALSGSQGGTNLIYWDLESGKPVWLFDTLYVIGVAISPDGRTALSAEDDGAVNWWNLGTGQRLRRLEGHTDTAWGVTFVDDGRAISASADGTLILWDLESGTALRRFLGHAAAVKRVAVSPDRRLALSASRDGTLILWDIQSGEPLRRYSQVRRAVYIGYLDSWHGILMGGSALWGADGLTIRWRIDADKDLPGLGKQNRYLRPLTWVMGPGFS